MGISGSNRFEKRSPSQLKRMDGWIWQPC